MIPDFDNNDNLPVGIHQCNWQEFCERYAYTPHRKKLTNGLELAMLHLKSVNCQKIWIDGSFITKKQRPNDYDVCWSEEGVDIEFLNVMHSAFLDDNSERQLAKYGGEFFSASSIASNHPRRKFLDFFQFDRNNTPKGIIEICL